MTVKDIKEEARHKLALNMHQSIVIYTVEFAIFITLVALVVMSSVSLGVNTVAAIVMMCYGILLGLIAIVGIGMINFAMTDFYLATYRCKPYNIRRLGETLARSNITKILLLSLKRTVLGFLLLLCFIVPGVIYFMRTSMANYLLIANPKMRASTALTASNKVMSGKTGTYFSLCMSLLGWYVLGVLTLGLGFIFIAPYTHLIKTVYYKRNLQGDKAVYYLQPQPVSPQQYPQQPGQTIAPQQQAQQPVQQSQPQGPAPIDTLAEEDVMDMNAAMRDFEAEQDNTVIDDVPEVPIMPVADNKKANKDKKTKEEKRGKRTKEAVPDSIERKIDGTGLVETERTLSAEEISAFAERKNKVISGIYSNSKPDAPAVNYFDVDAARRRADDFDDDFGVEPVVEAEPVIEQPAQNVVEPQPAVPAEDATPVISDNELDEFLKNFDMFEAEVQSEQSEQNNGDAVPSNDTQAQVVVEPVVQASVEERETPPAPDARIDRRAEAAERRRQAEERIARDRAALHERRNAQSAGSGGSDRSERAERIRREREQRLNNK